MAPWRGFDTDIRLLGCVHNFGLGAADTEGDCGAIVSCMSVNAEALGIVAGD